MEFLKVVAAAGLSFALGAVWYMALAERWMRAANIVRDDKGQPKEPQNPKIYVLTFLLQLLVAGLMRHVFELSSVETLGAGIVSGAGVGLFFISPWIAINNLYANRPLSLTLIDGGYATLGCAAMGLVLTIF